MKHSLFLDSETTMNFSSRSKAFQYVDKKALKSWMLLTSYIDENSLKGQFSVFNPFIMQNGSEGGVEYFKSEKDAMHYIGSFLNS